MRSGGGTDLSDWALITLSDGLTGIQVSAEGRGFGHLRLRTALGSLLEDDYDSVHRECGHDALPAGQYRIEAIHFAFDGLQPYVLRVDCTPCDTPNPTPTPTVAIDRFEPDDAPDLAKPIACGETQHRTLAPATDVDWLRLQVTETTSIALLILGGSHYVQLYSENGEALGENGEALGYVSGDGGVSKACGSDALLPGVYYLLLTGYTRYDESSYEISIACSTCSIANATVAPTPTWPSTPTPSLSPTRPMLTPTPQRDIYEPDDTADTASTIACGETQSRTLERRNDVDWVRFVVDQATTGVTIRVDSGMGMDQIQLQTDLGTPVTSNYTECGQQPLAAGAYRFAVSGYQRTTYQLSLECQDCAIPSPTPTPTGSPMSDAYEPDDSIAQAHDIECGETQPHTATRGDVDWVKLQLSERSSVTFAATGFYDNLNLSLFDGEGLPLNQGSLFVPYLDRRCGVSSLPAGTYYLEVDLFYFTAGTYHLNVGCSPCSSEDPLRSPTPTPTPTLKPDSFEPDDSRTGAGVLGCGTIQQRTFAPRGDVDWLEFEITEHSVAVIAAPAYLQVYDASNALLQWSSDYVAQSCGTDELAPGRYTVRLTPESADHSYEYTVTLFCIPCRESTLPLTGSAVEESG